MRYTRAGGGAASDRMRIQAQAATHKPSPATASEIRRTTIYLSTLAPNPLVGNAKRAEAHEAVSARSLPHNAEERSGRMRRLTRNKKAASGDAAQCSDENESQSKTISRLLPMVLINAAEVKAKERSCSRQE